jgi:hypothetical protein
MSLPKLINQNVLMKTEINKERVESSPTACPSRPPVSEEMDWKGTSPSSLRKILALN